jgi:hypothetical protein
VAVDEMEKRRKAGSFVLVTARPSSELLKMILTERIKKLVMRGLRWTDIQRCYSTAVIAPTGMPHNPG